MSSAGLAPDAECVVSADLLDWADDVFVMERRHLGALKTRFGARLEGMRLVCLGIPDRFRYMQPELVQLLEAKAGPLLAGYFE